MPRLVSTSRVLWIGDSISSRFTAATASVLVPVMQGIRTRFVSTAHLLNPARKPQTIPRFFVNAQSGRAYGDISPTIATMLESYGQTFTDFVIQLGINDAQKLFLGTLTIPTFTAQVQAVLAAMRAQSPGCNICLVGPWAHEPPDGYLVQIAQVNAVLQAEIAADVTFALWSNIPNTIGTYSLEGTHPLTPIGTTALAAPILAIL